MNSLPTVQSEIDAAAPVYGYGTFSHRKRGLALRTRAKRFRGFLNVQEWAGILLTLMTLGIAVYSVQRAKWLADLPSLVTVLAISIVMTTLLMRLGVHRMIKAGLVLLLGLAVTVWQSAGITGDRTLWQSLATSPNESTVHFAVFIVLVTWLAGALSIWLVLRKRNAWIPAALGLVVLLINLSNLPEDNLFFLPIYLFSALVFIGLNRVAWQRGSFRDAGGRYPARSLSYALLSVLVVSIIGVSAAWFVPDPGVDRLGFDASGKFIADVQTNALNIFASVPGKWNVMRSDDLETLSFGAPLDTRDTILFVVSAEDPAYWRIKRYQSYNSWGWSSQPSEIGETIKAGVSFTDTAAGREEFTFTVETKSKADVLLLTGEFLETDIPVRLETYGQPAAPGSAPDIVSVTTPEQLKPYQQYTNLVSISDATPAQLAEAGTQYPDWVRSRYLPLPSSVPFRVRQLASRITEGSASPFGRAEAIEDYLRRLTYNLNAGSAPRGDEVDHFLFQEKAGVCTDFATAMVVMLRSVGVPARLATGYLPGERDGDDNFIVRGRDYHAWPEVYFPRYGWIQFEPTPRPGLDLDLTIGGGSSGEPLLEEFFPDAFFPVDGSDLIAPTGTPPAAPRRNPVLPALGIALGVGVAGGLVWLIVSRLYQGLRLSGNPSGVYAKMCRLASLVGTGPVPTETPLEYCGRLSLAFPDGAKAIGSIGELYTEARFSPRKDLGDPQLVRLQKSWVELYPVLFKRRLPWKR